jgi:hypothetical protein
MNTDPQPCLEDIHEQVHRYARKEMVTLSGVRAYMVTMYLQVEMYTIFDDFIEINEKVVSKKLNVSILLLYKNVCINFVTYKFCYRINNVCINFVTV